MLSIRRDVTRLASQMARAITVRAVNMVGSAVYWERILQIVEAKSIRTVEFRVKGCADSQGYSSTSTIYRIGLFGFGLYLVRLILRGFIGLCSALLACRVLPI